MNGDGDISKKVSCSSINSKMAKPRLMFSLMTILSGLIKKQIAQLYQKGVNTIKEHIKHIYEDGELDEQATIRKFRIVQNERNREVSR